MKKLFNFLLMMAIAVISSTFVPKAMAQDSTASKPEHVGPRQIQFVLGSSPADVKRGFTIDAGITHKYGKGHRMDLVGSFGMPFSPATSVNSTFVQKLSFDVTFLIFPFKGKFGKMWAVGPDLGYYYYCNLNVISMLQDGALFTDLLKGVGANWSTQQWVISPVVAFLVPVGERVRLGMKMNPIPTGRFDFIPESNGWTHNKQWLNIGLNLIIKFGKNGEAVAKTKDVKQNSQPASNKSSTLNSSDY